MNYFKSLENQITEKIQHITRNLENNLFITANQRKKIYKELKNLVKQRENLIRVLEKLFPNEKYR